VWAIFTPHKDCRSTKTYGPCNAEEASQTTEVLQEKETKHEMLRPSLVLMTEVRWSDFHFSKIDWECKLEIFTKGI